MNSLGCVVAGHRCAELITLNGERVIAPNKCVCLEKNCVEERRRQMTKAERNTDTCARLDANSILKSLICDIDMTKLYHQESKRAIQTSLVALDPIFKNCTVFNEFIERLDALRAPLPAQWDAFVAKCRSTPHVRKHVSPNDMNFITTAMQEYMQSYVGGVTAMPGFSIHYDQMLESDVASHRIEVDLKTRTGDVFYDLELFMPLSPSLRADFVELTQKRSAVEKEDLESRNLDASEKRDSSVNIREDASKNRQKDSFPYGYAELMIGDVSYEKIPFVVTETGLYCRMMKRGLPSSCVNLLFCFLTVTLPVSPVFQDSVALPTLLRHRFTAVTFRHPLEKRQFFDAPICLQSDDAQNSTPFIVSGGCIYRVFVRDTLLSVCDAPLNDHSVESKLVTAQEKNNVGENHGSRHNSDDDDDNDDNDKSDRKQ